MDYTSRSIEDNAESNVEHDGPIEEVSERKNISKWPRDHSCNILAKNNMLFTIVLNICLRLN